MKTSDKIWSFIFNYSSHVYLSLGLTIVFMIFTLWNNANWSNRIIEKEKEKALVEVRLKNVGADLEQIAKIAATQSLLIKEQDGFMEENISLIIRQGRNLNELSHALKIVKQELWAKNLFYEALVEYMKKIGEWPPKIPPPLDPENFAESKAIRYEAY